MAEMEGSDFLWKMLEMPAVNRVATTRTPLQSQAKKMARTQRLGSAPTIRVSPLALHLDHAVGKRRSQFASYEIHLCLELSPLLAWKRAVHELAPAWERPAHELPSA